MVNGIALIDSEVRDALLTMHSDKWSLQVPCFFPILDENPSWKDLLAYSVLILHLLVNFSSTSYYYYFLTVVPNYVSSVNGEPDAPWGEEE